MRSNAALRPLLLIFTALFAVTACAGTEVEASSTGSARHGDSVDRGPHDRFPTTIALPDGFQPEGVTSGRGKTFYAGSLADGRIYRGDLRTGEGEILVDGVEGRVAVGIQYDARRGGRLWVAGGPTGAVTAYDARTGAELGRWEVPESGFLNDVAVTHDAVYATDSNVQQLAVIPLERGGKVPGADAASTLPLTGDISYTEGFNANGIRALRGGSSLVLVQSNTATLFNVDPSSGVAEAIEVEGGELAEGDGLELKGRTLFVVRGGGGDDIAVLQLRRGGTSATFEKILTDPDLDVPSTATFAAGRLWAVNARFGTTPTPTTPYHVVRVDLRR